MALGGIFAERFKSPGGEMLVSQDKFLGLLLRNGALTNEQLQRAIDSYRRDPQDYAWMLRVRHATLDKADSVFFVRYGRYPTENNDFPLNGNYYQICRTLHYDPDCFDEELEKLAWDVEGNPRIVQAPPRVLEEVQHVTSKKGNAWAFALTLLTSLASAVAIPVLITSGPMRDLLPASLAASICWIILLACGLMATRPRQLETTIVNRACNQCGGQLNPGHSDDSCPSCGIRFERQAE